MTGFELRSSTGAFTSTATGTKLSQNHHPASKPIQCHHSEDHFQMAWAMNILRLKIDEELKAHNFEKSDDVCGVIHVLRLQSKTATVLKVGCSSYPSIFERNGAVKRYRIAFVPMALKKVEAIHLYQSTKRAHQIERELHRQLRAKFGNVNPHNTNSMELYKVELLEAILVLLRELEQKPSLQEVTSRPTKKGNENILKRASQK